MDDVSNLFQRVQLTIEGVALEPHIPLSLFARLWVHRILPPQGIDMVFPNVLKLLLIWDRAPHHLPAEIFLYGSAGRFTKHLKGIL
jgi:hypothetical protein